MLQCHDCRTRILDHLYELLDASEAVAMDAHLRDCPACAATRDETARVKGLFASAARGSFPNVRFDAPSLDPGRSPSLFALRSPLASPSEVESRSRGVPRLLPWVVAAAVLLAIPGTVIPVLGVINRAETASQDAERSTAKYTATLNEFEKTSQEIVKKRSDAEFAVMTATQTHDAILGKWINDEEALAERRDAHKMAVEVRKPAAVQPGAPNELQLRLKEHSAAPTDRIVAEFRDQSGDVVYSQSLDAQEKGEQTVRLPANVWAKLNPRSELFFVVASVDEQTKQKTELQEKIRLLGPVFSTMLATDKPTYRPGETIYFRSLTLDRATFAPPAREQDLSYELHGPNGAPISGCTTSGGTDLVRVNDGKVEPIPGPDGKPIRGVGCGAFVIPDNATDGDYKLELKELTRSAGYPPVIPFPVTRTVKVRAGSPDVYRKEIGYAAASYPPGSIVHAWAELRLQGRPVAGAEVTAIALTGDRVRETIDVQPPVTGPDGRVNLRFALPPDLVSDDVRLQVTFKTKTGKESVADRVPVIGRNIHVEFFPEGGKLVVGVPCRVYVRATTPSGRPVDITGKISSDGQNELAKVDTLTDPAKRGANRGIGSFTYTPEANAPAWLQLQTPALLGANAVFHLPQAEKQGVALTIPNPVTAPGQPFRVQLRSADKKRNLVVGAYTRGRLSDTQRVVALPGQVAEVQLMAGSTPRGGVVRVTVFEEQENQTDLVPVVERLVFRKPGEALKLNFTTSESARPQVVNGPTELKITAIDEKGKPTAAVVYAAAVNSGVASGAVDRLPTTHFLLAGEIQTPDALEFADFLLTDHPKAAESLDLVLATQGWRHFVEQIPPGFAKKLTVSTQGEANLLTSSGQFFTSAEPANFREERRLHDTYWPRYEAAAKALAAAQAAYAAANKTSDDAAGKLAAEAKAARSEAERLAAKADAATTPVSQFRQLGWFAIAGFGLLALVLGVVSFTRSAGRLPFGIGTAGAIGLVAFLVVSLGMAERTQAASSRATEELAKRTPPVWPAAGAPIATPAPVKEADEKAAGRMLAVAEQKQERQLRLAESQAVAVAPQQQDKALAKSTPVGPRPGTVSGAGIAGALPGGFGSRPPGAVPPSPVSPLPPSTGPLPGAPSLVPAKGTNANPAAAMAAKMTKVDDGWRSNSDGRYAVTEQQIERSRDRAVTNYPGAAANAARRDAASVQQPEEKAKAYVADQANALRAQIAEGLNRKSQPHAEPQLAAAGKGGRGGMRIPAPTTEAEALNRVFDALPSIAPLVVREYAAPLPGFVDANTDGDTVLWQPAIVLPADGKATLSFTPGTASAYQIIVAGHTLDGRIGAVQRVVPVAPGAP